MLLAHNIMWIVVAIELIKDLHKLSLTDPEKERVSLCLFSLPPSKRRKPQSAAGFELFPEGGIYLWSVMKQLGRTNCFPVRFCSGCGQTTITCQRFGGCVGGTISLPTLGGWFFCHGNNKPSKPSLTKQSTVFLVEGRPSITLM